MNITPRKQRGAVLIISLVLLVVLTLLGLSAMQNTSLEEVMAGNLRSENVAFQAAEAGLRTGEVWLSGLTAKPVASSTGSGGVWLLDGPDPATTNNQPWWREPQRDAAWWASTATQMTDDLAFAKGASPSTPQVLSVSPAYVVEERGLVRESLNVGQQQDFVGLDYFQVTARGVDESGRSEVLVRSTFSRRF
jgi:type IV pilus assembly protein PilX